MKIKNILTFLFLLSTINAFSQIKLEASNAQYFEDAEKIGLKANSYGIYPVKLKVTVQSYDKTLYLKIYRAETENGNYQMIIDTMQFNEEYFDLFDDSTSQPGKKYYYKAILGKDKNLIESNIACGWGALTPEQLYIYFNTTISKSFKKMTLMNKPKALDKLGTEETKGTYSGTFKYNAKVKGAGGVATMSYNNYSDDNICFFTGDMITNANIFSSGQMEGSVKINGMYNATIYFDNVIIKEGKAAGGTYGVEPQGMKKTNIDYTYNFIGVEQ